MNSEQLWITACKTLITETGLSISDMPIKDRLKELFVEAVELHTLSLEASTSFLYSLYYFGQLSLIDMLRTDGERPFTFDFSSLDAVLVAQKRWAKKAGDYQQLMSVFNPLQLATDKLMHKFASI